MRKFRVLVAEVILLPILLGWLFVRYPDLFDAVIPWVTLGVIWHLTWEFGLESEWVKSRVAAKAKKSPRMIWIYAFLVGGVISILYLASIRKGLDELATHYKTMPVPTSVAPSSTTPPPQPEAKAEESKHRLPPKPANPVQTGPSLGGRFHEIADELTVSLGGVSVTTSIDGIKRGAIPIQIGNDVPFKLSVDKDNNLRFSFTTWGNGVPIEVHDNVVKVHNPFLSRNFGENAFEVIDRDGAPLFQMKRETANHMVVTGIFPTSQIHNGKRVLLWVSEDGIEWDSQRPANFKLNPIFKYPAWKYPGQYAEP